MKSSVLSESLMTSWSKGGERNDGVISPPLLVFRLRLLPLRRHLGCLKGGWGGVTQYLRLREVRVFHSERKVYCEGWGLIFPAGFPVELGWFLQQRLAGQSCCCFWLLVQLKSSGVGIYFSYSVQSRCAVQPRTILISLINITLQGCELSNLFEQKKTHKRI